MFTRRELLRMGSCCGTELVCRRVLASRAQSKTLLILGGTGFIGPHLTRAALRRGWVVTHFNRGKSHLDEDLKVETLLGDREGNLDALAYRHWDAVIDNTGYIPKTVQSSAQLLAPNVSYYMFTSSVCAYASFATPNSEISPTGRLPDPQMERISSVSEMGPGMYGPLKALCEQVTVKAFGGRTCIVRPGYIVGPGDDTDRFTSWLVRASKGGEMLAPGNPNDPIQFIDARDLAAWMIDLVERRVTGIYNAASPPRAFTMGALIASSLRASPKAQTKVTWISPEFLVRYFGPNEQPLVPWLPPSGSTAGAALTSVIRAAQEGLKARPLWGTIRDTLQWFQSQPLERQGKLRSGLDAQREAHILQAWKGNDKADDPGVLEPSERGFSFCGELRMTPSAASTRTRTSTTALCQPKA